MSVAFTREENAETAAEVELPDRPISPHSNLVTASGLEALANAMTESRATYTSAQQIEDAGERRRAVAVASREMRYYADRLTTAQVVPRPAEFSAVAFGHQVMFKRDDGRRRSFRRRSGSSERINLLRVSRGACSNRQGQGRCSFGGRSRDRDTFHRVGPECQREQCYRAATWRVLTRHRWCLARGGL